jgi:hypothetical protein
MIRILRFAGLYVETLLTFTQTQLHTPPSSPSLTLQLPSAYTRSEPYLDNLGFGQYSLVLYHPTQIPCSCVHSMGVGVGRSIFVYYFLFLTTHN